MKYINPRLLSVPGPLEDIIDFSLSNFEGGMKMAANLPDGVSQAMVASLSYFRRAGSQSFVVGPRLAEMFIHTSLSKIFWGEIKLPYQSIFVSLPDSKLRLWGGKRTGWHQVAGAFLTTTDNNELLLLIRANPNEKSSDPDDDAVQFMGVNLGVLQEKDIESAIEEVFSRPVISAVDGDDDPDVAAEVRSVVTSVIRIIINLTQYLSCPGAEVETHRERGLERARKRLEEKLGTRTTPEMKKAIRKSLRDLGPHCVTTVVGKTIEESWEEERKRREGCQTPRLHWVRGHWKMQPYGPRKSLRKRVWIQPYERGEDNPEESREYVVE